MFQQKDVQNLSNIYLKELRQIFDKHKQLKQKALSVNEQKNMQIKIARLTQTMQIYQDLYQKGIQLKNKIILSDSSTKGQQVVSLAQQIIDEIKHAQDKILQFILDQQNLQPSNKSMARIYYKKINLG